MICFSIVVPLYNKQNSIVQALESIKRQTYENFEVMIINDGSTDNSADIVHKWISSLAPSIGYKFHLFNQNNSGVSMARMNGVKKSNNDYIAFLDADDYWEKLHLENLSLLIAQFSQQVDIFSNYCIQLQNNYFIYPKLSIYENYFGIVDYLKVSMISNGFVNSSSVCIKKDAILKNPFPSGMKNFEDIATWARISSNKGLAFSSIPTAVYILENTEASSHIDFKNYLRFEEILSGTNYNTFSKNIYLWKFFLLHILFARLSMDFAQYSKQLLGIFGKSYIVSACLIIGVFIPRFLIKYVRNIRKKII